MARVNWATVQRLNVTPPCRCQGGRTDEVRGVPGKLGALLRLPLVAQSELVHFKARPAVAVSETGKSDWDSLGASLKLWLGM